MSVRNMWVTIERCDDIPGEWIAHCLDLDVFSQGTSLEHAVRMIAEAITLVLEDDAERGADPFARRAPAEFWTALHDVLHSPDLKPIDLAVADEQDVGLAVINFSVEVAPRATTSPPKAWMGWRSASAQVHAHA